MSEVVERVARALSRRHFMRKRQMSWQTSEFQEAWVARLVEDHWRNHEQDAKDAIEAMREPTKAMIEVMMYFDLERACHAEDNCTHYLWENEAPILWQAVIDEALK